MKLRIKKYFLTFNLIVLGYFMYGQVDTVVNYHDTVHIVIENEFRGNLQWQISYDNNNWINIENEVNDTLYLKIKYTMYLRARITEGTCDPIFSEKIQFIFNNYCPDVPLVFDEHNNPYNTIQIGNQCWLRENLRTGKTIAGIRPLDNGIIEKYCYNGDESYCEIYGGLYRFEEMMNYDQTVESQSICPDGWHIPSQNDWQILIDYLGGEDVAGGKLKAIDNELWGDPNQGASNSSGFTALPGGYRFFEELYGSLWFYDEGSSAYFWSSENNPTSSDAVFLLLRENVESITYHYDLKSHSMSVRCIKD